MVFSRMHGTAPISEILILLSAAIFTVALFKQVRLEPMLGYVVAGAIIGPFGLKLIEEVEMTSAIAEFGVVFLLFVIGLELSVERLRQMRWHVFGLGSMQVIITAVTISAIAYAMGMQPAAALIIGGGLALSSTAVVLQVIADTGEKSSQVGRLALAILILQDLAVLLLLVLVPQLASDQGSLGEAMLEATIKAVIAVVFIVLLGRLLFRPLFRYIAGLKQQEIFSATTLLVILGVSWISGQAGLSLALGAFLAGLLVAETEYRPQIEADIQPYKGLLLGLFFMSVGMMVNIEYMLENILIIISLTLLLIVIKAVIIIALSRLFHFSLSAAIHAGLLLAQGSEFAIVLFELSSSFSLLSHEASDIMLGVITLSMAVTPFLSYLGKRLGSPYTPCNERLPQPVREEVRDLQQHVVIVGCGRVGRTVARLLEAENIPYISLDVSPELVRTLRAEGLPIYYGDASRTQVLHSVRLERAKALIITHGDTRLSSHTIYAAREIRMDLPILVRAKNIEQVQRLERAGATLAIAEMFETSLQIGGALLQELGVADHEVQRVLAAFRADDYALVRNTPEKSEKKADAHYEI